MPDDAPRLQQVTLVVGSTDVSAAFYREVGLAVPDGAADVHVEIPLATDAVSLELDHADSAILWNASWRSGGGTSVIVGLRVATCEAVDELYDRLTGAGHPGVQPPFDAFWGGRYAIVADPDGNQVGLMSPIDEAQRSWPPTPSPDP
jgi:uncharacterized glyoxalase superfamily protein PhnB